MSFFPRTILLATDGSDEADLATQAAAELSKATASEVHVTYVLPTEADLIGPHAYTDEIGSLSSSRPRETPARYWRSGPSVSGQKAARWQRHTSGRGDRTRRSSGLPGCWGWGRSCWAAGGSAR